MAYKDTFSSFHPIVNFLYFAVVFVCSMCFMHPICLAISLISALIYGIDLNGIKRIRFSVIYMLPMLLLTAVINPAFNHEGATILTYLPSGNPLTSESIIYGIASSIMLISVILWFTNFNEVITSDKFVYIFGRIIPALSLVLSMALRFVPKFISETKTVAEAQKSIGHDISSGGIISRVRNAITVLSVMVTWSLENAIETADSMKSRGYGLPKRTAFSIYGFEERDKIAIIWLIFCTFYIFFGNLTGFFYFRYYPTIKWAEINAFSLSFQLVYLLLCLTPVIINKKEEKTWQYLRSKI